MKILNYLMVFCSMICASVVVAQDRNDAYIYIEGEKSIPFYVKVEGQMQSRLSKHYFIINQLAAGPTNIEIQFQKNEYPAQKFLINVPASGERSFMLKKVNAQTFSLFDLDQNRYLMAGNSLEDDQLPVDPNKEIREMVAIQNPTPASTEAEVPPFSVEESTSKKSSARRKKSREEEEVPEFKIAEHSNESESIKAEEAKPDRFVGFEMKGETDKPKAKKNSAREGRVRDEETQMPKEVASSPEPQRSSALCSEAMSEDELNKLASSLNDRSDEEARLSYLRKYGVKKCYQSEQVRIIAMSFESQSSRYEVARMLKDRTVDLENYETIIQVFNTNFIKNKFKTDILGK